MAKNNNNDTIHTNSRGARKNTHTFLGGEPERGEGILKSTFFFLDHFLDFGPKSQRPDLFFSVWPFYEYGLIFPFFTCSPANSTNQLLNFPHPRVWYTPRKRVLTSRVKQKKAILQRYNGWAFPEIFWAKKKLCPLRVLVTIVNYTAPKKIMDPFRAGWSRF